MLVIYCCRISTVIYTSICVGHSTAGISWALLSCLPSIFPFRAKLSIACGKRGGKHEYELIITHAYL